jgi:hypothetical protein
MLSKVRSGSLRLRFGIVALTIPITLSIPVTASAAVPGAVSARTHVTYVNAAKATSKRNWQTDYSVKFRVWQSSASIINADDSAVALASKCHDCGAVAIAFQVVFARAQSLTTLNQDSTADAIGNACVRCSTLAEAYQLVDVSTSQQWLTSRQLAGLDRVGFQLEALQQSRLSTDQIQNKVAELVNQAVTILTGGAGSTPGGAGSTLVGAGSTPVGPTPLLSPAINASSLPAQLTQLSQQPAIQLYVKIDHT